MMKWLKRLWRKYTPLNMELRGPHFTTAHEAGLRARIARLEAALKDFVEAIPPNPDFIAEDGVKVYGIQLDELDINLARRALEDKD